MIAMMSLRGTHHRGQWLRDGFRNPPAELEAWVLATTDALQEEGFDPSMHMLVEAVDLSLLLSRDMRTV